MNNYFDGFFKLSSKIVVYVPSTIYNVKIDNSEYVKKIAEYFSEIFGGCTSTNSTGWYKANNGDMIFEEITQLFSYCTTEQMNLHHKDIIKFLMDIKNELKQEALMIEYNGESIFL
jgi:hypothetical protein